MSALEGVRVLDFTRVISGPVATMLLGDLGATILKVEHPEGDDARNMTLSSYGPMSAYFAASNRNKRSLVLDLKEPAGRARVAELLRDADVVVDNFKGSTRRALGLDHETLSASHPRLVTVSVTGYGEGTPEAESPAYDLIVQARSGVMSLNGDGDGPPTRVGVPVGDVVAGMYAAIGTLAALQERERSGRGQHVEVAMLDAQLALVHYHWNYYDASGELLPRVGSDHKNFVPYGSFACQDGFVAIAVTPRPARFWTALCEVLGHPEWIEDPRYATPEARIEHRAALRAEIEAALAGSTKREWHERLRAAGVPAAPVNDLSDLAADEQFVARELLVDVADPAYGTVRLPNNPIRMEGALESSAWTAPPLLGAGVSSEWIERTWQRATAPEEAGTGGGDAAAAPLLNETFMARHGEPVLLGWRCGSCSALALGRRAYCPRCLHEGGRTTRLAARGTLESWSDVARRGDPYTIAYVLAGDGEDDETVRICGQIEGADPAALRIGQEVAIGFRASQIGGESRTHHYFAVPEAAAVAAGVMEGSAR